MCKASGAYPGGLGARCVVAALVGPGGQPVGHMGVFAWGTGVHVPLAHTLRGALLCVRRLSSMAGWWREARPCHVVLGLCLALPAVALGAGRLVRTTHIGVWSGR